MHDRRARFERLHHEHHDRILGFALRRTGDPDDARDVTADTFVAAWRRLDDVPHDPERARMWLYVTARNLVANQRRGLARRRRLSDRIRGTSVPPVLAPPEPGDEDAAAIGAAFGALSDADREVLLLAGWEGLDAAGIAEVVGCSAPTARVRLHRARHRFEVRLAEHGVQRSTTAGHVSPGWTFVRPDTEDAL